jgi:hypothetical protein
MRRQTTVVLVASLLGVVLAIAPGAAAANRPNIQRVVVSRSLGSTFVFRIEFAEPIVLTPDAGAGTLAEGRRARPTR